MNLIECIQDHIPLNRYDGGWTVVKKLTVRPV